MASSGADATAADALAGPVLLAYDGCELAKLAIAEAGRQLAPGRDALVVCVWQPVDVGFVPPSGQRLHAAEATEVREAAQQTAAQGALLAEQAGFRARSTAIKAAPSWEGILEAAGQCDASLIVLGSHRRSGLVGHLLGSVAAAVVKHSTLSVLVVHEHS